MKSILRMSEQELARDEAPGFTLVPAAGVSAAATAVAMVSMMLQYPPGEKGPLPGIDSIDGQLTIATGLGVTMFASAWLIRSVLMKRLQWAVLFSLMLHLAICLTLRNVVVDVPMAMAAEIGANDRSPQEMTLPDYGGAESLDAQEQEWERPTDVDIPENEQQQLERQNADPQMNAEPDQIDVQRGVQQAQVPDRQQRQQEMQRAAELEIQRQQQTAEADAPQEMEAPEVTTREQQQPNLQAQQMQRDDADLQNERRQLEELNSQVDPTVSTVAAARAEVTPREILELQVQQLRQVTQAAASESNVADEVEIAAAAATRQMTMEVQQMDAARQSQADLPSRQSSSNESNSNAEIQVQSLALSRSQNAGAISPAAAPSSGGAASMQRTAVSSSAAAGTSAESVSVSAAAGAMAAQVSAAAAASNVARGGGSVPTNAAGGGGAPSVKLSLKGIAALQSNAIGRSSGSASGPSLGRSVDGGQLGRGRSQAGSAMTGAAGSNAGEVNVARAAGAAGSSGEVLGSGPSSAASNVGRGGGALPTGRRANGREAPSSSDGGGAPTLAMTGVGRRSGGAAEAGLGRSIVGDVAGVTGGRGRRMSVASLPSGAVIAEQSGALVMAGPQASSASQSTPSGLSGPRSTSVERKSTGLAGLGSGPATLARRPSGLPGGISSSVLPSRSRTNNAGPRIGTGTEIAGFIKRAVPGISAIPSERISAGFSMRTPAARAEAVRQLGGNDVSEAAVERGLEWLAAHQYAAGNWSIHEMNCRDHDCGGQGQYDADPAATGLALLAFLGAGNTHESGAYKQVVQRGLNWLLENQKSDGDLFAADTEFAWFYSHGIASIALCEAYGMSKDRRLREPAQKAIDFITKSQQLDFGGWRYLPNFESDTSVSGWQLMALKSGQMAGLDVSPATYDGVRKWLDSVESKESPGRFAYHPTKQVTDAMTAEGLLMRQYLGADGTDEKLVAGASFLKQRLPRMDDRDAYYWYYATQVMFHLQGEYWDAWNASLRDMLVDAQDKVGPTRGSWGPVMPARDKWGGSGGRHYVTCMHLLMLEVYYRHLPLYIELK